MFELPDFTEQTSLTFKEIIRLLLKSNHSLHSVYCIVSFSMFSQSSLVKEKSSL